LHVFDSCVDELKVDFLNVFKMIETVAPLHGSYDPWRLGTSSGVALQVISRSEPSLARRFLGAVLMGAGLGAMYYPRRGEADCRCPGG
jgi:hypothetical protein